MRLESEQTFYRARFEVKPYESTDPVTPHVIRVIADWLDGKELMASKRLGEQHGKSIESTPVRRRLVRDIVDYHEVFPSIATRECRIPGLLLGSDAVPEGYDGGATSASVTSIAIRTFVGQGSDAIPEFWALDYDEPDTRGESAGLHWHTSVGVVSRGASAVVNVRVSTYVAPGVLGFAPSLPGSTTPSFMKRLLDPSMPFRCYVGTTMVRPWSTTLTLDCFESDFVANLLDPGRELPIMLVMRDAEGEQPTDVRDLAIKCRGLANVYDGDGSNQELCDRLGELFVKGDRSGHFGCGPGVVRIYQPRVDFEAKGDQHRHRYFTPDVVRAQGYPFNEMLRQSLTRNWERSDEFMVTCADVVSRERRAHLVDNLDRSRRFEAELAEYKQLLDASEAEFDEKRRDYDGLESNYKSLRFRYDELLAEYHTLKAEYEELSEIFLSEDTEDDANQLRGRLAVVTHDLADAISERDDARERLSVLERENEVFMSLDHLPDTLPQMLALIRDMYPTRVVVLPEAEESAEDFSMPEPDICWQILKTVPTTLWSLHFEEDVPNVLDEFRARTGFVLAASEGKMTNKDPKLARLREREYEGRTIDISWHVKKKTDNAKGKCFRLHYWPDPDRKVIVIGHCGDHLRNYSTQFLH